MQTRQWLVPLSLIAILLLGFAVSASVAKADSPPDSASVKPGLMQSLVNAIRSAWDFFGSVGEMVQQVGAISPQILGLLTCLALPLSLLGAWTLRNLGRILGMMSLRDNVRSFFPD